MERLFFRGLAASAGSRGGECSTATASDASYFHDKAGEGRPSSQTRGGALRAAAWGTGGAEADALLGRLRSSLP